eukprot:CAMPEP_0184735262 /NCGR_PEP_ID=MMETSP0314-20130426/61801_1 /TAXON_ID=38298 /ORGANISM="Rhodella maculata, Strain CCMP 736" /LENGTH=69 /DNA_ID=CAMNT_0027202295 /DNA_START=659 /DNA_END=865 /DNA_ORIENTATION=-
MKMRFRVDSSRSDEKATGHHPSHSLDFSRGRGQFNGSARKLIDGSRQNAQCAWKLIELSELIELSLSIL